MASALLSLPDAGLVEVSSLNPYREQGGRTFQDLDGYRLAIHAHLGLTRQRYPTYTGFADTL